MVYFHGSRKNWGDDKYICIFSYLKSGEVVKTHHINHFATTNVAAHKYSQNCQLWNRLQHTQQKPKFQKQATHTSNIIKISFRCVIYFTSQFKRFCNLNIAKKLKKKILSSTTLFSSPKWKSMFSLKHAKTSYVKWLQIQLK